MGLLLHRTHSERKSRNGRERKTESVTCGFPIFQLVHYTVCIACSGKLVESPRGILRYSGTHGERTENAWRNARETKGKYRRIMETIRMGKPEVKSGEHGKESIGEHTGLFSVEGMNARECTPNSLRMQGRTDMEMHEGKH